MGIGEGRARGRYDVGRAAPLASPVRRPGSSFNNPIDLEDTPTTPKRSTASAMLSMPYSDRGPRHAGTRPPAPQTPRTAPPPPRKRKAGGDHEAAEKRPRRHRARPPQAFRDVYARALSQRFFVLGRRRGGSDECPHETFALAGSTGNVYTVRVDREPSCDCPHAVKGNQCKHVLYVLARVLHAPFDLVYQLGLLSSELRAILPAAQGADAAAGDSSSSDNGKGKRKLVDGDCPICFCELDAASPESMVWCRAACGQNMHQQCFDMWAKTKAGAGGRVPCPMCRTEWQRAGAGGLPSLPVRLDQAVDSEGYANVASQLGISGVRDTSSYSDWLWRRARRQGDWS